MLYLKTLNQEAKGESDPKTRSSVNGRSKSTIITSKLQTSYGYEIHLNPIALSKADFSK